MQDVFIDFVVKILAALAEVLIMAFSTWLLAKLGKRVELRNIYSATEQAREAAHTTVLELQQTIVETLKAAHSDGKLTKDEIANLNKELLAETRKKMSAASIALLEAAGVDLDALIRGEGEALIARLK